MAKQPPEIGLSDRNRLEADLRRIAKQHDGHQKVVAFAARAALRAIPALAVLDFSSRPDYAESVLLPSLRAVSTSWSFARYALYESPIAQLAAQAAARAVVAAGSANAAAHAADAAAYSARTLSAVSATTTGSLASDSASAASFAVHLATRTQLAAQVTADILSIRSGESIAVKPLWPDEEPKWAETNWMVLRKLLDNRDNWWVWRQWYVGRLRGGDTYPRLSQAANERIEVARVLEIEGEDWEQGAAHVNAKIRAIIEREAERDRQGRFDAREIPDPIRLSQDEAINQERLPNAEQPFSEREIATLNHLQQSASPTVGTTANGQLDAQPNQHTDVAADATPLIGLPERQCAVVTTILSDLPDNTPKHLRTSLGQYAEHLERRRYQPIVGLLDDQSKIIKKAVGSGDAAAWLEDGQKEAFRLFQANHRTIKQAFPLSVEREEAFASTPLDEDAITPEAIKPIVDKLDEAVAEAHQAGVVSDGYQDTSHQLTDNLRVAAAEHPVPDVVVTEADRFEVSTKKRATLSSMAYYWETYRLANTVASEPMLVLAHSLAWALRELLRLSNIAP